MLVKANHDVRLLGTMLTLTEGKTYAAVPATNLPDYETKKLYFVSTDQRKDSILCELDKEISIVPIQSSLTRREYVHSALTVLLRDYGYTISDNRLIQKAERIAWYSSPERTVCYVRDIIDAAERLIPLLKDDEYYRRYNKITTDDGSILYKGE